MIASTGEALCFLNQVKVAKNILPPCWLSKNTKVCVAFGLDRGSEELSSLVCCIEKHDIQDHNGNQDMLMQLRMFADQIYGSNPTGQSGSDMLDLKMMMEGATGGPFEQYSGGSLPTWVCKRVSIYASSRSLRDRVDVHEENMLRDDGNRKQAATFHVVAQYQHHTGLTVLLNDLATDHMMSETTRDKVMSVVSC